MYSQPQVVELLLSLGASPVVCSREGRTALHWAANKVTEGKSESFLSSPVRQPSLTTPMHNNNQTHTHTQGLADMVNLLLCHGGCDINACDRGNNSAIHYASMNGQDDIIMTLLAKGMGFPLHYLLLLCYVCDLTYMYMSQCNTYPSTGADGSLKDMINRAPSHYYPGGEEAWSNLVHLASQQQQQQGQQQQDGGGGDDEALVGLADKATAEMMTPLSTD